MLEPVSLHQSRFNAPGIAPDARGVVLGKQGAMLFQTLDSLVGWFRVLSDEVTLDDLLPSLAIHEVRSTTDSLAFLVVFHAESSYLLDRAARVGALLGALAFTGSGKHLVKYRDPASPLGYDVDAVSSEAGDFVVYAEAFTQPLRKSREIPFQQLVFRLSPRRMAGPVGREASERTLLWLAVAPGLGASVLTYLHRARVECAAAMVEREGGRSLFGDRARGATPGAARGAAHLGGRYLLVRVHEMPLRILDLMREVPGVAAFRPVTDNVVVEMGFRHPINLDACKSVFDPVRFYLFTGESRGEHDAVDVVVPPRDGTGMMLADGEKLVAVGFDLGERGEPLSVSTVPASSTRVELRLVPSLRPPHRVMGTLVGWEQAEQLRRLVFALPPPVLAGCRVAPIEEGLLVLAAGGPGLDAVPLGEPLYEAAPSILLPLGWEFLPHVDDQLLAERVGGTEGRVVVFRRGAARPIAVDTAAFEPLGRRLIARIDPVLGARSAHAGDPRPDAAPTVVNDPAGLFPLWGYRDR